MQPISSFARWFRLIAVVVFAYGAITTHCHASPGPEPLSVDFWSETPTGAQVVVSDGAALAIGLLLGLLLFGGAALGVYTVGHDKMRVAATRAALAKSCKPTSLFNADPRPSLRSGPDAPGNDRVGAPMRPVVLSEPRHQASH